MAAIMETAMIAWLLRDEENSRLSDDSGLAIAQWQNNPLPQQRRFHHTALLAKHIKKTAHQQRYTRIFASSCVLLAEPSFSEISRTMSSMNGLVTIPTQRPSATCNRVGGPQQGSPPDHSSFPIRFPRTAQKRASTDCTQHRKA
jgi:hypothetical protein